MAFENPSSLLGKNGGGYGVIRLSSVEEQGLDEQEITQLLTAAGAGNVASLNTAMDKLYADLRERAKMYMRKHYGGAVTLQPTALVNETYLRLLQQRGDYQNRNHFLAIATKVMLRVLIDHQRASGADKRGGKDVSVTLTDLAAATGNSFSNVTAIEEALTELDGVDARKGQIVKLRAIWGFDMQEIAALLELSLTTVEREWRFAKVWLLEKLETFNS